MKDDDDSGKGSGEADAALASSKAKAGKKDPDKKQSVSSSAPKKAAKKKTAKKKKAGTGKKSAPKKKSVNLLDESEAAEITGASRENNLLDDDNELESDADFGRRIDIADGIGTLIGGVRSLSTSAIKLARDKTVDSATRMIGQSPEQLERMAKAGRSLQDLRTVTGASIEDVAGAIDLGNPDLLKAVEEGKAALPFEILLRLSSFYARNNPVPFILKYTRTYNPLVSKTLEKIGLDKLVIEAEREIQFVQILRSRDEARELSDEDFRRVHAFTEKAFDMALNFAAQNKKEDER